MSFCYREGQLITEADLDVTKQAVDQELEWEEKRYLTYQIFVAFLFNIKLY